MSHHLLGQVCALLAAVTWAIAVVLFKRSGEKIPPIGLNLYKNTVALMLLVPTLAILALSDPAHGLAEIRQFPAADFCILLLSGIVGIAIADTLFFYALNLIGVGLVSIADCAYAPSMVLFAWFWLGETLTPIDYVGGSLIVMGVFIASRHKPPEGCTRGRIAFGMLVAVLAIVAMTIGILVAKPIVEEMPAVWSTSIRMVGGMLMLALFALLGEGRRRHWQVFRPSASWKFALPGSILGTYFAMIFWIAGFKYTHAAIAAVLNQTSVVFAIILATVFLRESFSKRKAAAVVLAFSGVAVVTLAGWIEAAWRALLAAALPLVGW